MLLPCCLKIDALPLIFQLFNGCAYADVQTVAFPKHSQCLVAAGGDVFLQSTAPPRRRSLAPAATLPSMEDAPTRGLITLSHTALPGWAPLQGQAAAAWLHQLVSGWNTAWKSRRSTSETGQHTARRLLGIHLFLLINFSKERAVMLGDCKCTLHVFLS